jgi:hypothetical protein
MVSVPWWGQCRVEAPVEMKRTSTGHWWPQSVSLPLHLTPELTVADRRQKREIRQLEQELHKWQVLVDSITGEEARGPKGVPFSILLPTEFLLLPN